jgi:serine/threonine protein kinase
MNEKSILAALTHAFIVKLAGTFQDDRSLYMILEYVVGGEFFSHLRRAQRFENHVSRFYAAHVVLIFEYLHSQVTLPSFSVSRKTRWYLCRKYSPVLHSV